MGRETQRWYRTTVDGTGNEDLLDRAWRGDPALTPLAERLRPTRLDEVLGQEHVTAPGRLLDRIRRARGRIPSMILWGPPGCGKTTLARMLAQETRAHFEVLSATSDGVKRVREVLAAARRRRSDAGSSTVVFIDEIHRFNKGQQDALLADVEAGVCSLVGATTENPSFEINAALLSRARVVRLRAVSPPQMLPVLRRALEDETRGLGGRGLRAEDADLLALAHECQGDVRRALNTLELAAELQEDGGALDPEVLSHALGARRLAHDKDGDSHFALASALIKSTRANDLDAACYYLARLLEGGEDPLFVARRLVIFASEDVGNAIRRRWWWRTPQLRRPTGGMPEAVLPLTQAVSSGARPQIQRGGAELRRGACRGPGARSRAVLARCSTP